MAHYKPDGLMGSGPRGALEPLQVVWGALVHGALVFPLLALFVVGTGSQHYPGDYYPDYPAYEDYQYPEDSPPPPLSLTTVNSSFSVTCGEAAAPLTHDGVEVDLGLRAVVTQTGFRVRPVRPEDWGVWECGGEETGVAVLPTLGRPHLLEGAGRLLNPASELRVTEGRLLHFSCALLALKPGPLPQWPPTWTLAGEEKKGEDIGDGPGLLSRLPPLQVERHHHGARISCRSGSHTTSATLVVDHPPEFTIGREPGFGSPLPEGSQVTLLCTVEARPASSPFWEREGRVVSNNSRLEFPVLEARHEGWYVCSTSHRLGNFSSVGYYLSVKQGAGLHRTTTLSGRVVVEADGSAPLCREADGAQLQMEVVRLLRENNQLQEEKEALEKQVVDLKGLVAGKMGTEEALMTGAADPGPCCDNRPLLAALLWARLHYVKLIKL